MGIRSLVLVSLAAALFSVASPALADVDGGTTTTTTTTSSGTGGSAGTTTSAGTGGSAVSTSGGTSDCTVDIQSIDGTTCQACGSGTSVTCSSLGSDYNYVCSQSSTVAVYCNGPDRNIAPDNNIACAVSAPGLALGGGAAGFLAIAAALSLSTRRRRRA